MIGFVQGFGLNSSCNYLYNHCRSIFFSFSFNIVELISSLVAHLSFIIVRRPRAIAINSLTSPSYHLILISVVE